MTNADELHDALMLIGLLTEEETAVSIHHEGNGAAAEHLVKELVASNRATQFRFGENTFWAAAERLSMLQTIYPQARLEPE
jgi:ATP-dependent Lhr-like helicase